MNIKSLARRLRKQNVRGLPKLRAKLGDGEQRVLINVMPVIEALLDDRLSEAATRFLIVAFDAAHGGEEHQCSCCLRPWSEERRPILFVVVEFLKADTDALVCALCGECSTPAEAVRDRIVAATTRDLGLVGATAQDIAAAGHA